MYWRCYGHAQRMRGISQHCHRLHSIHQCAQNCPSIFQPLKPISNRFTAFVTALKRSIWYSEDFSDFFILSNHAFSFDLMLASLTCTLWSSEAHPRVLKMLQSRKLWTEMKMFLQKGGRSNIHHEHRGWRCGAHLHIQMNSSCEMDPDAGTKKDYAQPCYLKMKHKKARLG